MARLEIGSLLVYGAKGICRVLGVERAKFSGGEREYYLLCPKDDEKSVIYVPVDSERLERLVSRMLTPEEIDRLIVRMSGDCLPWISENILHIFS